MTSLTGKKIITIHILPNIARVKGCQATKFGQKKLFFKIHPENDD